MAVERQGHQWGCVAAAVMACVGRGAPSLTGVMVGGRTQRARGGSNHATPPTAHWRRLGRGGQLAACRAGGAPHATYEYKNPLTPK